MIAFLGFSKPFIETSMNVISIFDEIILLAITCLLLTFESFTADSASEVALANRIENVGYGLISLVLLHILGHLGWQFYKAFISWRYRV